MRIALATCSALPGWEVDDRPLHAALRARGVDVLLPVWNDPSVDWGGFDAVLVRTTWDYQLHRDAFVAWAHRVESVTRLFNPAAVLTWNTHKTYLRALAAGGAPLAPTLWLDRGQAVDVAALLAPTGWSRAFIKPTVGATASDTLRFAVDAAGVAAAQAHLDELLGRHGAMVQPYLERVETEGERSAIFIDGAVSHCVRKVPVPGDYRVQDDFGAHDEPTSFTTSELALCRQILAAAAAICPAAADLLYGRVDLLPGPVLGELELVEPSLFLRHGPATADRLADALLARLGR